MTKRSKDTPDMKGSSPACSMHEADDAYMGFAGKDELVAFLNELLEAERAGARVTGDTAREAGSGPTALLMRTVQKDEAHWCAMLTGHVKALGEAPTPKIGAFYEKAMAIENTGERIAFLNRGQGWVVRKLREMLPRVRDNQLHADLSEMLRSHEVNIALANDLATGAPKTKLQTAMHSACVRSSPPCKRRGTMSKVGSSYIKGGPMTEILETANKLVKQHGERAPDVAAERATELGRAGDQDEGTYWQSVMIQTKVLLARDHRV